MTEHLLDGSVTAPYWDRDAPPRLVIDSGDTVVFQCPEPCGQVTPEWVANDIASRWDTSKVHALLGPVDVRGAVAGGSLKVEILNIQHHGWGWTALIPGFGLLHDRFPDPHLMHWRIDDGGCHFGDRDIIVPFEPFVGCIGVAPAVPGRFDTIPPRANGGNLDLRDCGMGAIIYLPILRDGAGLCLGDGHAAQGDGELCGTAIESPLTITARITTCPERNADSISVITSSQTNSGGPRSCLTVATVGKDVRQASRVAVRQLLEQLTQQLDLPEPEVMMLISATANLRIAQAVNEPNWTIAISIPRSLACD